MGMMDMSAGTDTTGNSQQGGVDYNAYMNMYNSMLQQNMMMPNIGTNMNQQQNQ